MSFDLRMEDSVAVATLRGRPSPADADAFLDALEAADAWAAGQPVLLDQRAYDTGDMSVAVVHAVATRCSDRADVVAGSRIAVLVARDLEYGMNRMFLALVKWDADLDIFRSRDEALAWLTEAGTRVAG